MTSVTLKNHPEQTFEFAIKDWKSPHDLGNDFGYPEPQPGIYIIVFEKYCDTTHKTLFLILYVGSSKNLKNRFENHPLLDNIMSEYMKNQSGGRAKFWFRYEPDFLRV